MYHLWHPAFKADVPVWSSRLVYVYRGVLYAEDPLRFLSIMDTSLSSSDLKIWGLEAGLGSQWLSDLEPSPSNRDPRVMCDVASTLTLVLGVVQALEPVGRAGRPWCLSASLYQLPFPEGETKVSKDYWFAYNDSVSRQGIGNKTNFLASFPMHTTPYLAMPRLEAKNPSPRIWSENIWRVILKPQKHWESHKDV